MRIAFLAQLWLTVASQRSPNSSNRDENEVLGTPDVQCSEDAITFSVRTSAPFKKPYIQNSPLLLRHSTTDSHYISMPLLFFGNHLILFRRIARKDKIKVKKTPICNILFFVFDRDDLVFLKSLYTVQKKSFRGNIYVKGHYGMDSCRQEYYGNDFPGATFVVRIGDCGMRRIRQLQPHGMNYVLTFVANFHPHFMTKVDRAYNVRCFYAYIDKTVNADMDVRDYSNLPSESLEQQSTLMPECEYSIREGSPDGQRVRTSSIGANLVHRWDCRTSSKKLCLFRFISLFAKEVAECKSDRSRGDLNSTLAQKNRSRCPYALPIQLRPINYDQSLSSAYMVVEAFVFPDRSNVQFQCQVQICDKRDNECLGITPPNCPLMPRSEFVPNSVVDPSVNPTQVIATFEGTLRSAMGNAVLDGTLHPPGHKHCP
ncbi:unnamed protein product [Cylicostephanus goldi]|uniref:ZP domain-containing protein n=1 Tax=Cylicostephanus goldi TaxID=71465 RepID=A0A3P7ME31_CYLGO|nr:unnamed protein product [Cylicostephanus goldi]